MPPRCHQIELRVRYADTDQMGTYYNARVLEWFECGRSEYLRAAGKSYREMEHEGVRLPVAEAHVEYLAKARYDDLLVLRSTLSMPGKARFRFDVDVRQSASGEAVCRGYTVHVLTDAQGKPMRPPRWLVELATVEAPGDGESTSPSERIMRP
jgi:acyl-CoA thioester hydrolase